MRKSQTPNHRSESRLTLREYLQLRQAQKDLKRSHTASIRYESDVERQFHKILLSLQKTLDEFIHDKKTFTHCFQMLEDLKELFRRAVKKDMFDKENQTLRPSNQTVVDAVSESPSFSEDLFHVSQGHDSCLQTSNSGLKVSFKNSVNVLNLSSSSEIQDDKLQTSNIQIKLYESGHHFGGNFLIPPKLSKLKKNFCKSTKSKFCQIFNDTEGHFNDGASSQKSRNLESTNIYEDESKIRKAKHSATYCFKQ